MAQVMNRSRPLRRLERTIEHSQVFIFNVRSAFDGPRGIDVRDDSVGLFMGITQLEERPRNSVINNLNHPAAHQLLELDKSQVRFNSGGIAVHHESYSSSRSEHCYLRVPVAVL